MYLVLQVGELGIEDALRRSAEWAVGLGEDDDFVAGDGIFDGFLNGHGCSGRGGSEAGEEGSDGLVKYTLEHGTG